jgi:hypothetical protein
MLFFVPGNHDLWIQNGNWANSLDKFSALWQWCLDNNISVKPDLVARDDPNPVWIVPLLSWYSNANEGTDSLYLEKPGEDPTNMMWSDRYYIKWPDDNGPFKASEYFSNLNNIRISNPELFPVITFSHFLPRQEVMFGKSLKPDPEKARKYDRNPKFNFSRVAGSNLIEKQIRELNSVIHGYGHQHINRDRFIDNIRYVSHCLGYPKERKRGMISGLDEGLKLIWDTEIKDETGLQ